jgi:AcrR family transcriptional regulator
MMPTPTRRERLRALTKDEIKALAWAQMAEEGAATLSLRAVARRMGTAPSALYRYYTSRDELLNELIGDGFTALADWMEAAESDLRTVDTSQRWMALSAAYRQWAVRHRTEYTLIFGSPIPGLVVAEERTKTEMLRAVAVLFRVMIAGVAAGTVRPELFDARVTPPLVPQLAAWRELIGADLPLTAMFAASVAWTRLHGGVMLELFNHLPHMLYPAGELFDQQMRQLLVDLGGKEPAQ